VLTLEVAQLPVSSPAKPDPDALAVNAKAKLVISLLGASRADGQRLWALLRAHDLRAELRTGHLEAQWVSFTTLVLPRRVNVALVDPNGSLKDPLTATVLLIETPQDPVFAQLVLSVLREDRRFSKVGTLLAIASRHVHLFQAKWGFDDFIVHPYRPEELYSRLCELDRRYKSPPPVASQKESLADVSVDWAAHEVLRTGKRVALTHKEFEVLKYLWQHRGTVISRQQLLTNIWRENYEGGRRTVDTHVRRLRAKLGAEFPIETVRGAGYKIGGI
jgi:DNA-binding CsgD family transcriptional regulator